jgi:hypothetical protein
MRKGEKTEGTEGAMKNIGPGLLLILLLSGCIPAAAPESPPPSREEDLSRTKSGDPLEQTVDAYLICTAEAAVDAVLDGASLVQSQLLLADLCSAPKVELLAMIGDEARPGFAQRIKDWDLSTLGAIRERLQNLETSLKAFLDCSYEKVRAVLSHEYDQPEERFLENLVMREISGCYDSELGDLLHPRMPAQSAIGIARRDRVMLIAKERIMQEFYEEIRREKEEEALQRPSDPKGKKDMTTLRQTDRKNAALEDVFL